MFDARRRNGVVDDGNGYVETDPSGRYGRFDDVLGKGAMKTVYRAFDELNGMEVAWNQAKLCDVLRSPEALQRMYSEVQLLSSLRHDSIIRFHTSWVDVNKRAFNFITEMLTSGTLREYHLRYRRVDIRAVKNWSRQILNGLIYLHGHDPPVIHRDLKCDNIFVNGHLGQVKIGDLGLAAVLRGSQSAHSVIGTPEFMAPELYEEDYNELVDIYSFGMCVLEMLTSEYPYSECTNPAQIYKKVTARKLPEAFHRIQDQEAKRFIGRCLENVSKRSSAEELLLDPFLSSDGSHRPMPMMTITSQPNPNNEGDRGTEAHRKSNCPRGRDRNPLKRTDMTITGKMNPQDDTIFLKVKIADKEGHVRHIYFPFDTVSDTSIGVANEMVKELEITDRGPEEIAEVIDQEISNLVPGWKVGDPEEEPHHVYSYGNDSNHPFCYYSSSPTSSQDSFFGPGPSSRHGDDYHADWIEDDLFVDDDDNDNSSIHSGKYSAVNYCLANDHDTYPGSDQIEAQPILKGEGKSSTCLCPADKQIDDDVPLEAVFHRQCKMRQESSRCCPGARSCKRPAEDGRSLMRNRSMIDLRSQLLHQTLVQELSKRVFKTVGAVENIGFQMPCDSRTHKASTSSRRGGQKQGHTSRKG